MPYTPSPWVDGPAGNTPITAAQLAHVETQYGQAVSDAGVASTAAISAAVSTRLQVKEAPITPYQFGAVAPTAGNDNTTAMQAMFAAAVGTQYTGAEIYFPPGLWRYSGATPLQLTAGMKVRGAGRGKTRVASITGATDLFGWNTNISGVRIEDLWLESTVAGSGVFGPGASGGLFASVIEKCLIVASTDTSYVYKQNNGQSFIHNTFRDCELQRTLNSSVVPFQIINSGGAANFNQLNQVRMNGLNNVNTPFFHVESTLSGTYLTDWTMTNILGEQNPGGLIRVLGAFNWSLTNVTDEDSGVDYVENMVDFQTNGAALAPRDLYFVGVQRHGRQMAAGKYEISCPTATNVFVANADPTPVSGTAKLNLPPTASVVGTSGYPQLYQGTGTPLGVVSAVPGSTYMNLSGGTGTSFYVKESGTGSSGWVAK